MVNMSQMCHSRDGCGMGVGPGWGEGHQKWMWEEGAVVLSPGNSESNKALQSSEDRGQVPSELRYGERFKPTPVLCS
jgi:hypothetical protein